MAYIGKNTTDIAKSNGCSVRHVRRIIRDENIVIKSNDLTDDDVYKFMHRAGLTMQEIADWQGITKQAVSKSLKQVN